MVVPHLLTGLAVEPADMYALVPIAALSTGIAEPVRGTAERDGESFSI